MFFFSYVIVYMPYYSFCHTQIWISFFLIKIIYFIFITERVKRDLDFTVKPLIFFHDH